MEFTLFYRGELKANGNKDHKHEIRKAFHPQLNVLWNQPPLNSYRQYLDPSNQLSIIRNSGLFQFAPLITEKFNLVAGIEIILLRPEAPGSIISKGGDIDNRIKTLLDALKSPSINELPNGIVPGTSETPFFCLTEDDNLITDLSIKTDRLLLNSSNTAEVVLLIKTKVKQIAVPWTGFR